MGKRGKQMVKKKQTAMDQVMHDLLSEELSSSVSSNSLVLEEFRSQGLLSSDETEGNSVAEDDGVVEAKSSSKKKSSKGIPPAENLIKSLIRFKPKRQKEKVIPEKEQQELSSKIQKLAKQNSKKKESAVLKVVDKNIHLIKRMNALQAPIILNQSENLRIAQERNKELEKEIERLRVENERLFDIENHLSQLDSIRDKYAHLQRIYTDNEEQFSKETKKLNDTIYNQQKKITELKDHNKSLQDRLSNNIHQIRVRERELENRLELVKNDSHVLIREKDQYILDLKRQIDRIKMDLDRQKERFNEVKQELEHFRGQSRRALRSLNASLDILRGESLSEEESEESEESEELKKA